MSRYFNVLAYVKSIISELGCQIAIKDFVGFIAKDPDVSDLLNPYYIHKSSFCMYMKSHREMWTRCQETSKLLMEKCESCDSYFVGACYCGCSEMVIPVKHGDRVIAAICIYGFETDAGRAARRIERAVKKYKIDREEAMRLYAESVRGGTADFKQILLRCGILADFFRMYYIALVNAGTVNPHIVYGADASRVYILSNALEFIRINYANDIHVVDIAAFCRCSESYINHIFKKYMNQSISRYINQIRVAKAKELIAGTLDNFNEISGKCGFSDPNYFSFVFKSLTGISPSKYKKSIKGEMVRS